MVICIKSSNFYARRIYRGEGETAWMHHAGLSSDKLSQPFGQDLKLMLLPGMKEDGLSHCQQRRTSNVLILLHQTMILDDWSARRSETAAKISATDLLIWI